MPEDPAEHDPTETLPAESMEDLYEHAPAGYLSSLPNGVIVRANKTLLTWLGHESDAVVGRKRLLDLLAPGARIYYETHYAPLLQMQGSIREIAVELVRADGTRLPVLLNSVLVEGEDGEASVIRTTVFDASDRRRYEQELLRARADAEERARAALALAHVNEGVLLVGTEGVLGAVNPAAVEILGLPADGAQGAKIAELVDAWDALASRIPVGGPGERIPPATLPFSRAGSERWLEAAGIDSGEGVVYTLRDVTAERRLEQVRSDLASTVAHELRTPLTGVLGAAQTLSSRGEELGEEGRRTLVEMILAQGERLQAIVDQTRLASSLDAGELEVERARLDLAELAAAVVAGLADRRQRERVELELDSVPVAEGDPQLARQVVAALLDNALKYSTGQVRLRAASVGSRLRLTVSDDGPGIPPDERERVFERFYRLDPSLGQGVSGAGLGLYIARELTQRMGGRIAVEDGPGTTVAVELPAVPGLSRAD